MLTGDPLALFPELPPCPTCGVGVFLLFGFCIVLTLWVCFGLDYTATRNVYFSVAMLHVLAVVSFLLRMT